MLQEAWPEGLCSWVTNWWMRCMFVGKGVAWVWVPHMQDVNQLQRYSSAYYI
jgi:hypothetical protein